MPWPVSDEFRKWLVRDHTVAVRFDVVSNDEVIATLPELTVGGGVTVARQDIQRQGDVTFVDEHRVITPADARDLLDARTGNQLRPHRGIAYPDLDPATGYASFRSEVCPLGTLRITRSDLQYPTLKLTLKDRGWVIQRAKLDHTYVIPSGTNYVTAMQELVVDRYGEAVTFRFEPTPEVTPLIALDIGADPWAQLQDMALALGKRLFFDPLGTCVLATDRGTLISDPDWVYSDDALGETPLLAEPTSSVDTEDAVNAVVCVGESPDNDAPVRGAVYDDDPASPLQWGGSFGRFAESITSPTATTVAMATAAARQKFESRHGVDGMFELPGVVNPALEVADIMYAQSDRERVAATFIVDGFPVPFTGAVQQIQTRLRRVISL